MLSKEGRLTVAKPGKPPEAPPSGRNRYVGREYIQSSTKLGERSPDGKWRVTLKEGNVLLAEEAKPESVRALTQEGTPQDGWVRPVSWAPDGRHFALWRERVDLFHAPHYVLPALVSCRSVVTIHDCIHLMFPQYLPNRMALTYARTSMAMAAACATRVMTVSETSKADIIRFFGTDPAKIDVIYNAYDERFGVEPDEEHVHRVRERYQLHDEFVLYAGNVATWSAMSRATSATVANFLALPSACASDGFSVASNAWCDTVARPFRCPECEGTRLRASVIGARRTAEEIRKDAERDYFMSAEEALEYGLIDHVIEHIQQPQ